MPHIRIRNLSSDQVQKLSLDMPKDLAAIMSSDESNFTMELISSEFFVKGQKDASFPFIEVLWFDRPLETRNRSAQYITERVKALVPAQDVVVVFLNLEKPSYYENGSSF